MLRPWKLEIQLDKQLRQAIYLQIADAIIADIQSGRLPKGTVLPGSRKLAQDLGVNRNTVVEALQVLVNEEWLVAKERSGTLVADVLPVLTARVKGGVSENTAVAAGVHYGIRFDDGHPDSKIAPVDELARAYRQIFKRQAKWQIMGYGDAYGDLEFRRAVVNMLNHLRGMRTNEAAICITRGSQMAMYLTAHCLFEPGDCVLIENPGYQPAWKAFESSGATLLPVGVDKEGLVIEEVVAYLEKHPNVKAIYTTPHHQYPTTVTLSLQRRLELIRLSNKYGFAIIEDDYDNEFHFGYRPVLPLCSYVELENYVYIGTMSKVVAPALRIGYLVSNQEQLLQRVGALRKIIDVQGDAIMEQAVLQLIQDGAIKRHLKKATAYYKGKRNFTAALLTKYLKEKVDFSIPEGGLAFWIVPKKPVNWKNLSTRLQSRSMEIISPSSYSFQGEEGNGIRLSYGSLPEEQLELGIKKDHSQKLCVN
ncbi:PLP-dependent aminotransferase family protein [Flavobacterium sp. JP2137]|uniref:MocR-like pyridoxine biosynthesis transcription factor PdxR n=1 Tax=Flavobacterium sp. JP2137 TaxID=3414510 RepID=UPI003D2FE280